MIEKELTKDLNVTVNNNKRTVITFVIVLFIVLVGVMAMTYKNVYAQVTNTPVITNTPTSTGICPENTLDPNKNISIGWAASCGHCITQRVVPTSQVFPVSTLSKTRVITPHIDLTHWATDFSSTATPISMYSPTPTPTPTNHAYEYDQDITVINDATGYYNVYETGHIAIGWIQGLNVEFYGIVYDLHRTAGSNIIKRTSDSITPYFPGYGVVNTNSSDHLENYVNQTICIDRVQGTCALFGYTENQYGDVAWSSDYSCTSSECGKALIYVVQKTVGDGYQDVYIDNVTVFLYGQEPPKLTATPTPTEEINYYCTDWEYSNDVLSISSTPIVNWSGITVTAGECYTVLPGIDWDMSAVDKVIGTDWSIEIPEVKTCVNWVDIPSLGILGFNIPIELFSLPILALLVRWIMGL